MELSIIIPVYNEEKNIEILYKELKEVMKKLKKSYEIIFVDDGSTDNTYKNIKKLRRNDKKIKVIRFRKNFGKSGALNAGFDFSKGKIVFTMDGDLQDDPKHIPDFLEKINNGYDAVIGWREKRRDPPEKRVPSKIYNWLSKKLTGLEVHDNNCGFKCFKKESLRNIKLYGEMHRYIMSLVSMNGFKVGEVKVEHRKRMYGKTKYDFTRLFKGLLDLLYIKFWMSYSTRPLHFFGFWGIIQILLGIILGLYNIIKYRTALQVGPLLLLSVMFLINGVTFIMFGFIGEILVRAYYEISSERNYKIRNLLK